MKKKGYRKLLKVIFSQLIMVINESQKKQIKELLIKKVRNKLVSYKRETSSMPFLAKLMQNSEQVAAYSFIHSLATTLGMSIYEQVAKIIAEPNFDEAKTGYDVKGKLSNEENLKISQIMQEIKNHTREANKEKEIKEILECSNTDGREIKIRADLYLRKENNEYYFEIKTAKPNIDVFNKTKQKLLEWVALRKKKIETILAIPYNPYYPNDYQRFTVQGVLDEEKELYVGEKFWDFIGGIGTYKELLSLFDEIGKELKEEIQNKIKEVAEEKMEI